MTEEFFDEHIAVAEKTKQHAEAIAKVAEGLAKTLISGNKILICGNGGSAADAQHFAAELVGRYRKERTAMPAIALTTDTSILTAVGNDYGYEEVFARQVEALGEKGDSLVIISTSGNSKNLVKAAEKAKAKGMQVVGLLGKGGGAVKGMCDSEITVPSESTPRIQEMHGLIIHIICETVENKVAGG